MVKKPKIVLILLAYNAEDTLADFYKSLPKQLIDEIILFDDASQDKTYEIAKKLKILAFKNKSNLGYGGNLKKALATALKRGADIIIDIHPDGEYLPDSIPMALEKIQEGKDLILGNRFFEPEYINKISGMYPWKIVFIRALNAVDNFVFGVNLKDFHQGFRLYTKSLLEKINYKENSNNYLFSFELIAQAIYRKSLIAEVPVKTKYSGKKRGASLKSSINYSIGTLKVLLFFVISKLGFKTEIFKKPKY